MSSICSCPMPKTPQSIHHIPVPQILGDDSLPPGSWSAPIASFNMLISILASASGFGWCSLVLYRYIENIEISIRYRYIVSYRIAGRNIEIFDISRYQISIYHFAEFSFIYSFSPRFDSLSPGISIRSCSLIEPIRHCLLT